MEEKATRNATWVKAAGAALVALMFLPRVLSVDKLPHYVFLLPDGYTGWIQVIFATPKGSKVTVEDGNAVLPIGNDGVVRLSIYSRLTVGARDEFFYLKRNSGGETKRIPVPSNYVCTEQSGMDTCYDSSGQYSDGYSVGRAGKPGDGVPGSSWWLFVGPPELRKKMAKPNRRNPDPQYPYLIDSPDDDPTPGRVKGNS